jgi:hypothetical protein
MVEVVKNKELIRLSDFTISQELSRMNNLIMVLDSQIKPTSTLKFKTSIYESKVECNKEEISLIPAIFQEVKLCSISKF